MKPAFIRSVVAAFAVYGLFAAATPICHAWGGWDWYGSSGCCCPEQYKIVNCYTRCAWKRTWHAPNALDTPLRQYYIPRPPACCWPDGSAYGCGYAVEGSFDSFDYLKCQCQNDSANRPLVAPDASTGFSPAGFERLGQVRNELDVVGATPGASDPAGARTR
jgi:hypothetical protein